MCIVFVFCRNLFIQGKKGRFGKLGENRGVCFWEFFGVPVKINEQNSFVKASKLAPWSFMPSSG